MKTLKKRLQTGLASVYLVEGDDFYLFDKALSMIKSACDITLEEFNVSIFDDENFSLDAIYQSSEQLPIVDKKRLIVIKGGSPKESDKKKLTQMLLKIPKTTVVVVLDYNKNLEILKKDFVFVDANRMDREMVKRIVQTYLSRLGKTISPEGLNVLIEACNGYLTRIMCELNKLVCYDLNSEQITADMINELVNKDAEYSVFELTEALAKKDGDKAVKLMKEMEKQQGIFALITNQFRRLFYVSISDKTNSELASLLGVKEYAIIKAKELARKFSKAQLKKICSLLEEVDYSVKSGLMLQTNALQLLLFNIIYI